MEAVFEWVKRQQGEDLKRTESSSEKLCCRDRETELTGRPVGKSQP